MSLNQCLKDLERIKRKSLRRLAENCKSEDVRNSVIEKIALNYKVAKRWIDRVYSVINARRIKNLSESERYKEDNSSIGYPLSNLNHHINQIKMLRYRH